MKYLQYGKTMLVSRNKPDVMRKDFETVGIVEELHRSLFPVYMEPTLASHGLRLDVAVNLTEFVL